MKLMPDLTVAARLKLLGIVIGGSLLIVGGLFVVNGYLENRADESTTKLNLFLEENLNLKAAVLRSQVDFKDFLSFRRAEFVDSYANTIKDIFTRLETIKSLSPDPALVPLIDESRTTLNDYQRQFKEMAELRIDIIGLDEKSGLRVELRDAVHNVEEKLDETGQTQLLTSILMLRRHEKDFFMRVNDDYLVKHREEHANFIKLLNNSKLSAATKRSLRKLIDEYRNKFVITSGAIQKEAAMIDSLMVTEHKSEPIIAQLNERSNEIAADLQHQTELRRMYLDFAFIGIMVAIALIVTVVGTVTFRSILNPLRTLRDTVSEVTYGNYDKRSGLSTHDELGEFGRAFDTMLDDRLKALDEAERENERLNNSIIDLLEAVAKLSDRDLTVSVPIKEDVTGPVADAMNMMARETAKVLGQINRIAGDVESVAVAVREQGNKVTEVAGEERRIITDTLTQLNEAARTMNEIASLAEQCNLIAETATATTSEAFYTVNDTVAGMAEIREIISETEKRIKRLGERSQEITGIVEIINNIAERTHVLALNASMQAAVAGEAGRGFAVVADEVQRLAESSRNSTSQISSLVNNIRTETSETMATMNRAIEQVIAGSNRAEQTGKQMQLTMKTTSELVAGVNQIAERSSAQAEITNALLKQALNIQKSTEVTSDELSEQGAHTENLVLFSKSLLDSVRVFKLPEAI